MAEIFGAVVAGFAVCHELSRLAKFIHEANKTIQNSRKDIAELSDETVIFAGLYGTFLQSCEDNPEACQKTASSLQRLKSWADSTIHDLKNILSKVDILRLNKDYRYSFNETLRAELKWFFSKNAVTLLRTSLSVARQSIEGFSNLMCLGKLNEELKVLRSALRSASKRQAVEQRLGMSLEDKIKSIQQRVEIRQSTHFTNKRLLNDARAQVDRLQKKVSTAETTAAADKLLDFAESFDTYAEEILPSELAEPSDHQVHQSSSTRATPNSGIASGVGPSRTSSSTSSSASSSGSSPSVRTRISLAPSHVRQPAVARPHQRPMRASTQSQQSQADASSSSRNAIVGDNHHQRNRANTSFTAESQSSDEVMRRFIKIGDHEISLSAKQFRINNHVLGVPNYELANRLFDDLLKHRDKLGALDQAITDPGPSGEWFGIPGWKVDQNGITRQPEAPGIRDV